MAYYFAVERNPNSYEAINIKKTKKGKKIFSTNREYECTLEEIDRYTTQYENLKALSCDLNDQKEIPWSTTPVAIVYVNGGEIRILQELLFSESKKYLEQPQLVGEYIFNKFMQLDTGFFKELINTQPENSKLRELIEGIILEIEASIINKTPLEASRVFKLNNSLIYNVDESEKVIYPQELNYEKLHNVVVFIADYENKSKELGYTRKKTNKNT